MTFQEYLAYTSRILSEEIEIAPYDDPAYFEYTKLNATRMKRWLKTTELLPETETVLKSITRRQHWIVISEPWCGDAAHILPFLYLMSKMNRKITLKIELRDSDPQRINRYLTGGTSKSIPILIVKNGEKEDQFVWGPRPEGAKQLRLDLMEAGTDRDELKVQLQQWYNSDKGEQIQKEITAGILKVVQDIL